MPGPAGKEGGGEGYSAGLKDEHRHSADPLVPILFYIKRKPVLAVLDRQRKTP